MQEKGLFFGELLHLPFKLPTTRREQDTPLVQTRDWLAQSYLLIEDFLNCSATVYDNYTEITDTEWAIVSISLRVGK